MGVASATMQHAQVFPRVEKSLWTERLTCRVALCKFAHGQPLKGTMYYNPPIAFHAIEFYRSGWYLSTSSLECRFPICDHCAVQSPASEFRRLWI
eukprot:3842055-Amphidinium_carterae.1